MLSVFCAKTEYSMNSAVCRIFTTSRTLTKKCCAHNAKKKMTMGQVLAELAQKFMMAYRWSHVYRMGDTTSAYPWLLKIFKSVDTYVHVGIPGSDTGHIRNTCHKAMCAKAHLPRSPSPGVMRVFRGRELTHKHTLFRAMPQAASTDFAQVFFLSELSWPLSLLMHSIGKRARNAVLP